MSKVIFKEKRIVGNWKISKEAYKTMKLMSILEGIKNSIFRCTLAKLGKNIDREVMSMGA